MKSERLMLAALMLVLYLQVMDFCMVSVALPAIRTAYHMPIGEVTWIVVGYTLPFVVLMPLFSRLGDIWSKKRVLLACMAVFALGCILCAWSVSFPMLVAGRFLQGVSMGGIRPLSMAIIAATVGLERRGGVLGTWESMDGLAAATGPFVGGYVVQYLGWETIFPITLVLTCLAILLLFFGLPDLPGAGQPADFDWAGAGVFSLAVSLVLLTVVGGGGPHWASLVGGLLMLFAFGLLERRSRRPIFLSLEVLRRPGFLAVSISAGLRNMSLSVLLFGMPLFLTDVLMLSPVIVGIVLASRPVVQSVGTFLGGGLSDRLGTRNLASASLVTMAVGVFLVSRLGPDSAIWTVATALVLVGLGAGLCLASFSRFITRISSADRLGGAIGLYSLFRFSADVVGPAAAGQMLDASIAAYRNMWDNLTAQTLAYGNLYVLMMLCVLAGAVLVRTVPGGTANRERRREEVV